MGFSRLVFGLVANGYSRYDTICNPDTGHCACVDGYKPEGLSCRKCKLHIYYSLECVYYTLTEMAITNYSVL